MKYTTVNFLENLRNFPLFGHLFLAFHCMEEVLSCLPLLNFENRSIIKEVISI